MAIVNERHSQSKPVQVDPKTGKPIPSTPARAGSPPLDTNGSDGGFFGSFFASKNKKKMAAMEPPPPTLKASGTLSERETIEVEVISKSIAILEFYLPTDLVRTSHQLLLQYCKEDIDRYGAQGNHAEPRAVSISHADYHVRN
jgi:dynamin 1-like protein